MIYGFCIWCYFVVDKLFYKLLWKLFVSLHRQPLIYWGLMFKIQMSINSIYCNLPYILPYICLIKTNSVSFISKIVVLKKWRVTKDDLSLWTNKATFSRYCDTNIKMKCWLMKLKPHQRLLIEGVNVGTKQLEMMMNQRRRLQWMTCCGELRHHQAMHCWTVWRPEMNNAVETLHINIDIIIRISLQRTAVQWWWDWRY